MKHKPYNEIEVSGECAISAGKVFTDSLTKKERRYYHVSRIDQI